MNSSRSDTLRWKRGELRSGPYRGHVWGAHPRGVFIMIVQGKTPTGPQFEVLFPGNLCVGERKTLAEAKAFALASLRGYMARLGTGLAALGKPAARAA